MIVAIKSRFFAKILRFFFIFVLDKIRRNNLYSFSFQNSLLMAVGPQCQRTLLAAKTTADIDGWLPVFVFADNVGSCVADLTHIIHS